MQPTKNSKIKSNFGENSSVQCKLVLQMWAGLVSEKKHCLQIVPECYKTLEMDEHNEIPLQLSTFSKYVRFLFFSTVVRNGEITFKEIK